MIKEIEIKNLKCVNDLTVPCSKLNLFVGTNSSGKSTILQGLLFFAQNVKNRRGLNGDFVSLGTLEENRCVYSEDKSISVAATLSDESKMTYKLHREGEKLMLTESKRNESVENAFIKQFDVETKRIQYLSCHRIGPENLYAKNMDLIDTIGNDGQYAIAYLDGHATDVLDEKICKNKMDFTLLGQVNWWLNYIVGVEVATEEIIGADSVRAEYSMGEVTRIRPQNIGAGISYLISVIIVCLASTENSIIVIENPEIHLHPSAQAKVTELLYFICQNNRQLFVETHSDHIFDGFRVGITKKEINDSDVNIYFTFLNNNRLTEIMRVQIGRLGRIENQRKDLFDQFDLDINRMIGVSD